MTLLHRSKKKRKKNKGKVTRVVLFTTRWFSQSTRRRWQSAKIATWFKLNCWQIRSILIFFSMLAKTSWPRNLNLITSSDSLKRHSKLRDLWALLKENQRMWPQYSFRLMSSKSTTLTLWLPITSPCTIQTNVNIAKLYFSQGTLLN